MLLIAILCLYTAFFALISYIQIRFLEKEREKKAEILSQEEYKRAADIAIENEKFELFSNFYSLIINIAWLGFGFAYLKSLLISENSKLENTLFLLAFLMITALFNLPLSIYKDFVKNKAQGFSNMSVSLFIKDSLKSLALFLIFGFAIIYVLLLCYEFLGAL